MPTTPSTWTSPSAGFPKRIQAAGGDTRPETDRDDGITPRPGIAAQPNSAWPRPPNKPDRLLCFCFLSRGTRPSSDCFSLLASCLSRAVFSLGTRPQLSVQPACLLLGFSQLELHQMRPAIVYHPVFRDLSPPCCEREAWRGRGKLPRRSLLLTSSRCLLS